MAYVNGRWMEREERTQLIESVSKRIRALHKLEKAGKAEYRHQVQLRDDVALLAKLKRVQRAEYDMLYFMHEYFSEADNPGNEDNLIKDPKYTIEESALFHRELCSLLDAQTRGESHSNVAWCVGRNHAKTAYLSNGYLCHQLVFRYSRYIVLVSLTVGEASKFIRWTRNQLALNQKLRDDFGVLMEPHKPRNVMDNNEAFITKENQMVEAKGTGSQVRGLRNGSVRPDLFLLDDLESKDNTNTPEAIQKNIDWFQSEMIEALSADGGRCIYMGTIVCFNSLLDYVIKNRKDFKSKKFPAVLSWADRTDLWDEWKRIYNSDDSESYEKSRVFYEVNKDEMLKGTKVLWESRFPYIDLMEKRENNGIKSFNQEYLGNPTDEERQIFKPEYFHKFIEEDLNGKNIKYYGAIDFAMGKERGDYSAIVTLAKNMDTGFVYVYDVFMERVHPDILLRKAVELTLQYQYEALAVEAQHAQEFFADQLKKELQNVGYPSFTRLQYIKQRTRKQLRIEALLPDIQRGIIKFRESQKNLLEQFEMFPMHPHDDGADALAMAVDVSKSNDNTVIMSRKRSR